MKINIISYFIITKIKFRVLGFIFIIYISKILIYNDKIRLFNIEEFREMINFLN